MDSHRDQDVDDGRAGEHQRHYIDRQAADLEGPDDAGGADRAQRAGDRCRDKPAGVESGQIALGAEATTGTMTPIRK